LEGTVEMDRKGRLLVPAKVRRKLKSRRFTVKVQEGTLIFEPLPEPEAVRGKYRGLLKVSQEEMEEMQERFLSEGRR